MMTSAVTFYSQILQSEKDYGMPLNPGKISGQNANDKMPLPKTPVQQMLAPTPKPQPPDPKHINQWHFIHWRFVRGIQTGYPRGILLGLR